METTTIGDKGQNLGLKRDNGKEHGNYYLRLRRDGRNIIALQACAERGRQPSAVFSMRRRVCLCQSSKWGVP